MDVIQFDWIGFGTVTVDNRSRRRKVGELSDVGGLKEGQKISKSRRPHSTVDYKVTN